MAIMHLFILLLKILCISSTFCCDCDDFRRFRCKACTVNAVDLYVNICALNSQGDMHDEEYKTTLSILYDSIATSENGCNALLQSPPANNSVINHQ